MASILGMVEESLSPATTSGSSGVPLSWVDRAPGMPQLPGTYTNWLKLLKDLLRTIAEDGEYGSLRDWPSSGQVTPVKDAVQHVSNLGLISKDSESWTLTADAQHWLATAENARLARSMHQGVRFFGEILSILSTRGSLSHKEVAEEAAEHWGLEWKSDTQIRVRTTWLRVLGLVDFYGGRLHLLQPGIDLLPYLAIQPFDEAGYSGVTIGEPIPLIAEMLNALDVDGLKNRTRGGMLYLPSKGFDDKIAAIKALLDVLKPSATVAQVEAFCASVSNSKKSSVQSIMGSLRAMGLIVQVASDAWAPSPLAAAWLTTSEPLDLARIAHSKIWYFGEILYDLDSPEVNPFPKGLARRSVDYDSDKIPLPDSAVTSRVSLLRACGLVMKLSTLKYVVTPLGRVFRETIPCQSVLAREQTQDSVANNGEMQTEHSVGDADGTADAIANELEAAAFDSSNFVRLERAAVACFDYLGMPSRHIGGNDNPDGLVLAGIGKQAPALALETKSSANGRVSEEAANLLGLPEHRQKVDASTTILVGPGFERRLLQAADSDAAIAVVMVSLLSTAVRKQAIAPLTLDQLAILIDPALTAELRAKRMASLWQAEERKALVEKALLDVLESEAVNPLQEDGWLDIIGILRELRRFNFAASRAEVEDALTFLTSPRIRAVQVSEVGYRSLMPKVAIARRIYAIGNQWR